jgi:AraC family transcriptional regulator
MSPGSGSRWPLTSFFSDADDAALAGELANRRAPKNFRSAEVARDAASLRDSGAAAGHDPRFRNLRFQQFRFLIWIANHRINARESALLRDIGGTAIGGRGKPLTGRAMEAQTHGARKYPVSALLGSSAALGWSTIAAELRSHGVSQTPLIVPQHTEICLAIVGNKNGLVRRTGAGQCQQAVPRTGAIWLSPIGVGDNEITITAPIAQTLHLYLPAALFARLKEDFNLPAAPAHSIRYLAGIRDEVILQIGRSILAELSNETAAGRMYVEAASLALGARLLQKYCDSGACAPAESSAHSLDHIRLRRVLDYIAANIRDDITLVNLASIAGYSLFHFARKFTLAMGVSPRRYISSRRLENAMAELAAAKLPLAEIAFNAQFSSQASFTRAFHRATGMTPKEYQRRRR